MKTDLNIQNNLGKSCLHLLLENNLIIKFSDILKKKELNLFISDNKGITCFSIIDKKEENFVINLVVDSYYYLLNKNKDKLKINWEIWCGNNMSHEIMRMNTDNMKIKTDNMKIKTDNMKIKTDNMKIKTDNKKKESNEIICKDKIKNVIYTEKKSIPLINDLNIKIDNGIVVKFCNYTGSTIDILFGLIFLYNKFNKEGLNILIKDSLIKSFNDFKSQRNLIIDFYGTK
jgi:hypothetical protein